MDTNAPINPSPVDPAPAKPRLWKRRGFKTVLSLGTIMAVIAGCVVVYARATNYGKQVVEAHPVDARIELANSPAYLDRRIVNALLDEAYQFAQRDQATYDRARNPLDAGILRDFADLYTGTQAVNGQTVKRQALGFNAWIKNITEVRREVARDKSLQTIQILAEWRVPAAWVRVGDALYLVDPDGTRLPGDYTLADRGHSKLMEITGVDLPVTGGRAGGGGGGPQAGERWGTGNGAAEDLAAGMQLAESLRRQPFATQIDAIDVANLGGRRDPRAPWILLDTVWRTAAGAPHVVQWGRTIGAESFYEVKSEAKIKSLNELYQKFSRIDAGREYVDIRTEVVGLALGG